MRNLEGYRVIYAKDLKEGDRFVNGVCLTEEENKGETLRISEVWDDYLPI